MLVEREVKRFMKWKTAAFMVLLVFTASAFAVTSTLPVMADSSLTLDIYTFNPGGPIVPLGDRIPGGPGGPT